MATNADGGDGVPEMMIDLDEALQDSSLSDWRSSSVNPHDGTDETGCISAPSTKEQNHLAHSIENVPSDLWYLIFEALITLSVDDNLNADPVNGILSMRHGAWSLSQVCQQWRSIVLGMSNLWSSVELHEPPPTSSSYRIIGFEAVVEFLLYRLALQLGRSRDTPLRIISAGMAIQLDSSQLIYRPVYQLLLDHASRWEEVHFSNPYPILDDVIRDSLEAVSVLEKPLFPNLRSHKWRACWPFRHGALRSEHAPKLDSLSMHYNPGEPAPNRAPSLKSLNVLPSQIRSLELANFRGFAGILLLKGLSETLEDLGVTVESDKPLYQQTEWWRFLWPPADVRSRIQMTFTRLKKMRLSHSLPLPVFKHFLEYAKAPFLNTLELNIGYAAVDAQELVTFISVSQCSLKSLTLGFHAHFRSSQMTSEHMVDILSAVPHLECLEISAFLQEDGPGGDPVLDVISVLGGGLGGTEIQCCPNLRTLRLRNYQDSAGSAYFGLLADMIEVRWRGTESLESFGQVYLESVQGWNALGKEEARLGKFKDSGLNIAIWLGGEGHSSRRRLL